MISLGVLSASAAPAASASTFLASGGSGSCQALPVSFGYTEFSPGNVSETTGDSDGPTAFGGTSTLSNFSIASNASLIGTADTGFVARGQVTATNGVNVHNGNFYYVTGYSGVTVTAPGTANGVSQENLPGTFAAAASADSAFATQLGALPTSSGDTIGSTSSALTLTATTTQSSGDYVWDLSAGQLTSTTSSITITGVPTGGSIIVNVPYSGAVTIGTLNVSIDGTSAQTASPGLASSTIFNFYEATSLSLGGDWAGTLFAPNSATTFSHGHVYGSVVGATLTGTNESTYGPLSSALCIPSPGAEVPQGAPVALLGSAALIGAGGLLLIRRRTRRSHSLV